MFERSWQNSFFNVIQLYAVYEKMTSIIRLRYLKIKGWKKDRYIIIQTIGEREMVAKLMSAKIDIRAKI